ncbi:hypothetical protein G7K_6357-t1 [Saitoella complicata NRRL Y-17804]|uniref:C2H2-type domain-containing protein n=2 Tax=Saitoella complicata (strain BCRC 22490 / CBS 7301 / JCM 7358 / NBRC 10748 / NRRL Y-17804) TaxID=698492 RepID=A0A0E9NQX3_SAICN|nr:hypothetical protein G7K_6357-t1 [Saitoella complicata NRRL Y-17804]
MAYYSVQEQDRLLQSPPVPSNNPQPPQHLPSTFIPPPYYHNPIESPTPPPFIRQASTPFTPVGPISSHPLGEQPGVTDYFMLTPPSPMRRTHSFSVEMLGQMRAPFISLSLPALPGTAPAPRVSQEPFQFNSPPSLFSPPEPYAALSSYTLEAASQFSYGTMGTFLSSPTEEFLSPRSHHSMHSAPVTPEEPQMGFFRCASTPAGAGLGFLNVPTCDPSVLSMSVASSRSSSISEPDGASYTSVSAHEPMHCDPSAIEEKVQEAFALDDDTELESEDSDEEEVDAAPELPNAGLVQVLDELEACVESSEEVHQMMSAAESDAESVHEDAKDSDYDEGCGFNGRSPQRRRKEASTASSVSAMDTPTSMDDWQPRSPSITPGRRFRIKRGISIAPPVPTDSSTPKRGRVPKASPRKLIYPVSPQSPGTTLETHDPDANPIVETNDKNFTCTLCKKGFRRMEHLKRHVRSLHTMEKPYECYICKKHFSRSDNLTQHMRVHGIGDVPSKKIAVVIPKVTKSGSSRRGRKMKV